MELCVRTGAASSSNTARQTAMRVINMRNSILQCDLGFGAVPRWGRAGLPSRLQVPAEAAFPLFLVRLRPNPATVPERAVPARIRSVLVPPAGGLGHKPLEPSASIERRRMMHALLVPTIALAISVSSAAFAKASKAPDSRAAANRRSRCRPAATRRLRMP
jgi:hypothetical protein